MVSFLMSRLVSFVQNNEWLDRFVTPNTWYMRLRLRSFLFLRKFRKMGQGEGLRLSVPKPEKISKVLLLDYFPAYGDTLHINGLVKFLRDYGIDVSIAAFPKISSLLFSTVAKTSIYDISDAAVCEKLAKSSWDVVVDLSFSVTRHGGGKRAKFLSKSISPVLGLDAYIGEKCEICSEWIDISKTIHVDERFAKVAERLMGISVNRLTPYVGIPPLCRKEDYVYVNCVGMRFSRSFSQEQIDWMVRFFSERKIKAYFYCSQKQRLKTSDFVERLSPKSFDEACRWIGAASGVISPDTSVVHAASAYGLPLLAFFAGNFVEICGYPVEEAWRPIGNCEVVVPDTTRRFGKEVIPISCVGKDEFFAALERFILRAGLKSE